MILSNTTICIDVNVEREWVLWMQSVYLPMLRETGCLAQVRLFRIQSKEEEGGASYALQVECKTAELYSHFVDTFKSGFDSLHQNKFGSHFAAFTTLLQEV